MVCSRVRMKMECERDDAWFMNVSAAQHKEEKKKKQKKASKKDKNQKVGQNLSVNVTTPGL